MKINNGENERDFCRTSNLHLKTKTLGSSRQFFLKSIKKVVTLVASGFKFNFMFMALMLLLGRIHFDTPISRNHR